LWRDKVVGHFNATIYLSDLFERKKSFLSQFFPKHTFKEKKAILINKKPIIAGEEELRKNSRARSAKLRIIEKI
jgi:16S rRNA C1402 N4-methylase RsmH